MDWFKHTQYIPNEMKRLQEAEAAYALREAWHRVYGSYPSDESLAVLWAKSALETGRWRFIHCYNFGNIKHSPDDKCLFTMFECSEEVTMLTAKRLMAEDPERVYVIKTYSSPSGVECASIKIKPGHLWSQFRAFKTPEDGAEDYIRFISQRPRLKKAWEKVMQGDPAGYAHELKLAGYYTADEGSYRLGVMKLFKEFLGKKDKLLAWKAPMHNDTIPTPAPIPAPPVPRPSTKEEQEHMKATMTSVIAAVIGMIIAWLFQYCR